MDSLMKNNLQIIKDFCDDILRCQRQCPFYNHISNCCMFTPEPISWDINDSVENPDYEGILDDVFDIKEAT